MPKSSKQKLAYQREYNARPENVAKRVQNNAARREAIREGKARVGDGTNVDHRVPLDKGGTNAKGYHLGGAYGIAHNAWLSARWLSATEVTGAPLAIDVLFLDLNARF